MSDVHALSFCLAYARHTVIHWLQVRQSRSCASSGIACTPFTASEMPPPLSTYFLSARQEPGAARKAAICGAVPRLAEMLKPGVKPLQEGGREGQGW
jgi:hypothetical protein